MLTAAQQDAADALRYAGLALQLVGVSLAAYGISEVRREWTELPGIPGRARAIWQRVNRRFRKILHRPQSATVTLSSAHLTLSAMGAHAVGNVNPPRNATVEQRLDWLEERAGRLATELADAAKALHEEREAREAGDDTERVARLVAVADTQRALANFAGGGLRLQTWGVACLLVGITLATIPDKLASL